MQTSLSALCEDLVGPKRRSTIEEDDREVLVKKLTKACRQD